MAEAVLARVEALLGEVLQPMRDTPDVTEGVAETASGSASSTAAVCCRVC